MTVSAAFTRPDRRSDHGQTILKYSRRTRDYGQTCIHSGAKGGAEGGAKGTRTPGLLHAMPDEFVWHGPRWSGPCRSNPVCHLARTGVDRRGLGS